MKQIALIGLLTILLTCSAFAQGEPLNYRIRHSLIIDPAVLNEVPFDSIESWEVRTSIRVATAEDMSKVSMMPNSRAKRKKKGVPGDSRVGEFIHKSKFKLKGLNIPSRREVMEHFSIPKQLKALIDKDSEDFQVFLMLSVKAKIVAAFRKKPKLFRITYPVPVSYVKHFAKGGLGLIYRIEKDENGELVILNEWFSDE